MNPVRQEFDDPILMERIEKNNDKIRKKKHDLDWLTADNIKPYLQYDQRKAAEKLNISISTLKRHFYKLGLGRWPIHRPKSANYESDEEEDDSEEDDCCDFSFNSWENLNSTNIHNISPVMVSYMNHLQFNERRETQENRITMNMDLNNRLRMGNKENPIEKPTEPIQKSNNNSPQINPNLINQATVHQMQKNHQLQNNQYYPHTNGNMRKNMQTYPFQHQPIPHQPMLRQIPLQPIPMFSYPPNYPMMQVNPNIRMNPFPINNQSNNHKIQNVQIQLKNSKAELKFPKIQKEEKKQTEQRK